MDTFDFMQRNGHSFFSTGALPGESTSMPPYEKHEVTGGKVQFKKVDTYRCMIPHCNGLRRGLSDSCCLWHHLMRQGKVRLLPPSTFATSHDFREQEKYKAECELVRGKINANRPES